MTNRDFAEHDPGFRKACQLAGLLSEKDGTTLTGKHAHMSLTRQAGKWRSGKGIAFKSATTGR